MIACYGPLMRSKKYCLPMLAKKHIAQYAVFYLLCFLLNYAWSFYHGLLFSQIEPVYFINKIDITGNLLMLSGIQHKLIASQDWRIFFDLFYLVLPIILTYACLKCNRYQTIIAISTALFNIIYNYYYSMMSFVSIEVLIGWMIVPLIFAARWPERFYFTLHSVRILFILFFFSAALWKIRAGGIFNSEQMSGILISQHATYLIYAHNTFSNFLIFLITHKNISYALYCIAFLFELIFIFGFFTLKFDKYLLLVFCLFIIFNYILMEINYFTWLPFAGCLYFSKYRIIEINDKISR